MGKHSLLARPGESRFPVSRGWEPVACKRVACFYNDQNGHCAAQKTFSHDEDGRCEGFIAKSTPQPKDSE